MEVVQATVAQMKDYVPMFSNHYDEVPLMKEGMTLDLNWELYEALEAVGFLRVFVAVDKEFIAGYLVAIASPMPHHNGKFEARTDCFYVAPEYRDRGVFGLLLDEYLAECKRGDISAIMVASNETFPVAGDILASKGLTLSERVYILEDKDGNSSGSSRSI